MRILMASDYFYPFLFGGGERQIYEIAKRLAKKHEVHLITRRLSGLSAHELHEGIHIHRVLVPSKAIVLESPFNGAAFMLSSFFKSLHLGDFDVYAPQQFLPIPPLWISRNLMRKPIVVTIHDVYREMWTQRDGFRASLMSIFEKILLSMSYEKVITVSDSTKRKLVLAGIPEEKIEVVPNGVNVEDYDKVRTKRTKRPRIIYTGRLVGYKNVDDLIRAISKLRIDAELYVVGDGPAKKELHELVKKLGLQNKVIFTGFINEVEKIKLLKSSRILVLPSSTEGFGISLIEAMAARTPVISSDIPALREVIGDEAGLMFELRDVDDLKEKLEHLLVNKSLWNRLSEHGYKLVRKKFSCDLAAERVERVFKACSA